MSSIIFNEILDYAIRNEEEAFRFYTDLAGRIEQPSMKQAFLDFAKEEMGHKVKLLAIKEGKMAVPVNEKIQDLQISDYLVEEEIGANLDYQQALILAMKKEKAAYKLYLELSEVTTDKGTADTFRMLAQEEAKHKLRFEIEYDERYFQEN